MFRLKENNLMTYLELSVIVRPISLRIFLESTYSTVRSTFELDGFVSCLFIIESITYFNSYTVPNSKNVSDFVLYHQHTATKNKREKSIKHFRIFFIKKSYYKRRVTLSLEYCHELL